MEYEPKEGVDYLVDLYAVIGVDSTIDNDELRKALNQRSVEYHPDKLQGVAPEFQQKGERMIRLLNRARAILLDTDKRQAYDHILSEWQGPISDDGTPIITMNRYTKMLYEQQSFDEISAEMDTKSQRIREALGYSPNRLAFIQERITELQQAGKDIPQNVRDEYEDALLQYDRTLAVDEAERSQVLDLQDINDIGYRATLDYATKINEHIEAAKHTVIEQRKILALGGVSTQLALLSGERNDTQTHQDTDPINIELPAYYEPLARSVQDIAIKRQDIVHKRLENFVPTYPTEHLQASVQPFVLIGMGNDQQRLRWFNFSVDTAKNSIDATDIPDNVRSLLATSDYEPIIKQGFNILTFTLLEQIDPVEQLYEAIEKYAIKFNIGTE